MQEVLNNLPLVERLIPPPLSKTMMENENSEAEDTFFEQRAKLMGEDYDYELFGSIYCLQSAIEGAFGLALSESGETNFYKINQERLEEMEEEIKEIYKSNFLAVDSYRSDKNRHFSEVFCDYVDLRKAKNTVHVAAEGLRAT
jgi:hypothetical protein